MQNPLKSPSILCRHQRQQRWGVGVVLGVVFLSFILTAGALYYRDHGRPMPTAAPMVEDRLAGSEEPSETGAQTERPREALCEMNALETALTNRADVTNWTLPAIGTGTDRFEAEKTSWLEPLLFPPTMQAEWRWDAQPPSYRTASGINNELTSARWRFVKTNALPLAVLPKLGREHWSVGVMIVPYGPEGVNKQGVQTSSYLIGIKGSLP